jgi:hypothetical protein
MSLPLAFLALALTLFAVPIEAAAPSIEASAAKPTDGIRIRAHGHVVTVEVRSPSGVGSGKLSRAASAWPGAVNVRLKAFREIEHFRATAGATTLICALERREGVVSERVCRLNGEAADPPTIAGKDFQIVLPAALFASNPDEIVLEWVDYWR